MLKEISASTRTNRWDRDMYSHAPSVRLSPCMENVKRKFMSWLLEGQEKEAVVNFQHLMREAVRVRGYPRPA